MNLIESNVVIAEVLAYLIVADKQIHSSEMRVLEDFFNENQLESKNLVTVYQILGDADQKKSFDSLLAEIKGLAFDLKTKLMDRAFAITCSDGHLDKEEIEQLTVLINQISFSREEAAKLRNHYFNEANEARIQFQKEERKADHFAQFKLKFKSLFASKEKKKELRKEAKRILLKGPEYSKAIQKGAEIAMADCTYISQILVENQKVAKTVLNQADQILGSSEIKSDEDRELKETVNEFLSFVKTEVQESIIEGQEILNSKKRAMNSFSLAFLGRTKAGKSTLHYVMTGEGNAFIGKGQERTTRYNRVYEWDHLRIIDTPGIGAAESGGRSDEEIALSIVDEADLICYVVTSDNIQEVEFQFLRGIRKKNKPVVILLNVKENITIPLKFKQFVENPEYWFKRTDEQNIQGHINRIKTYVNHFYRNKFVKIIPVHFLAARLSTEEKYQEYANLLYKGSHMEEFLDFVRESILDSSTLRRSQTIVDGTNEFIHNHLKKSKELYDKQAAGKINVLDKKKRLLQKINSDRKSTLENTATQIRTLFSGYKSKTRAFAEENYDREQNSLERAWKDLVANQFKIEKKVQGIMEAPIRKAVGDVEDYLKDTIEDLGSFIQHEFAHRLDEQDTFNTKGLMKGIGTLGSAVTALLVIFSNPAGWVVGVLGALSGLFSFLGGLFKSKEEKKREAIDKIYTGLSESLDNQMYQILNAMPQHLNQAFDTIESKVSQTLNILIQGFSQAEDAAQTMLTQLGKSYHQLNLYYGKRIYNYAFEIKELQLQSNFAQGIEVIRHFGENITIKCDRNQSESKNQSLSDILQEPTFIIKK